MAYILAGNPSKMSTTGMDRGDLVIATALAALFGSALMGLWANLPPAVAPAMGSNVIFAREISGIVWGWGPCSSPFSTSPRC